MQKNKYYCQEYNYGLQVWNQRHTVDEIDTLCINQSILVGIGFHFFSERPRQFLPSRTEPRLAINFYRDTEPRPSRDNRDRDRTLCSKNPHPQY